MSNFQLCWVPFHCFKDNAFLKSLCWNDLSNEIIITAHAVISCWFSCNDGRNFVHKTQTLVEAVAVSPFATQWVVVSFKAVHRLNLYFWSLENSYLYVWLRENKWKYAIESFKFGSEEVWTADENKLWILQGTKFFNNLHCHKNNP